MSQIGLILVGWLLGTLTPGVTAAISRLKRRAELLPAIGSEVHAVRYTLTCAAHGVRSKYGTMDKSALDLFKPILLDYRGIEDEGPAASEKFRRALELGEAAYLQYHQMGEKSKAPTTLLPVPYHLPLLRTHIGELSIFPVATQALLLRIDAELTVYNEQVANVRKMHDLTFSLSGVNYDINVNSLNDGTKALGKRAEIAITIMNALVDSSGHILPPFQTRFVWGLSGSERFGQSVAE